MAETADRPNGDTIDGAAGTDAPATGNDGDAANAPAASIPVPLDSLGRELLALRAMAVALIGMVDATLTTYRLAQLGTVSRSSASAVDDVRNIVDVLRGVGKEKKPGKFFGDRAREAAGAVDVHVPPIGSAT